MLVKFLPLAITRVDEHDACVGSIADDGRWVRPSPVTLAEVTSPGTPYRYFCWVEAQMKPSALPDARPEDHDLCNENGSPKMLSSLADDERLKFLLTHLDPDVESAFANERSLGLVEVSVGKVYLKQATGGRHFIRVSFSDASGTNYDWIVPDIMFGRVVWPLVAEKVLPPAAANRLHAVLGNVRTFFTVGLTNPNQRFPGKFRDCHPLVVGIHTDPDYYGLLK